MKPAPHVKTPAQYIASLPADRAKTIATVRAFVNKHIPRGYDECLVWGTIGWAIPLSIPRHSQRPAAHLRRALVAKELLLPLPDGTSPESEPAPVASANKVAAKRLGTKRV